MSGVVRVLCLLVALSASVSALGLPDLGDLLGGAKKKPNIVFILGDDHGYSDVGYHGDTGIVTPNIDALAAAGVKLENYYVQPLCSPTRTSLLSGRYTVNTGLGHFVILNCQQNGLSLNMPTLPEKLHDLGYRTYAVGKWHAGYFEQKYTPTYRGFDKFFGFYNAYNDHYNYSNTYNAPYWETVAGIPVTIGSVYQGLDLHEDGQTPTKNYTGTYSSMLYTQKALEILDDHRDNHHDKPFFLYLPYQVAHFPMQAPPEFIAPYEYIGKVSPARMIYAAMVATLDQAVGNVSAALIANKLMDNTIFIYSSDNGGHNPYGGINWPYRGDKGSLWEGGMKATAFINSPLLPKNHPKISNDLMHVTDWFPTILRLAGGNTLGQTLDGYDMWNTITTADSIFKSNPRKEIVHQIDPLIPATGTPRDNSPFNTSITAALRMGDFKLITGNPPLYKGQGGWFAPPENSALVSVANNAPVGQNVFLFNIKEDPLEKNDLSGNPFYKVILDAMLFRLAEVKPAPMQFELETTNCNPATHDNQWVPWVAST